MARHLSTEDIAAHTKSLGAKVASSDDRLESHLQEKFEHELGSLEHRESSQQSKPDEEDMASKIVATLRNPEGIRQVVIANEILRRPDW